MTKFAYKDEKGLVHYKEVSDRKKCLSQKELSDLINQTPLNNHVFKVERDSQYHIVHFNYWAGYPLILAEINSRYGRGIEVIIDQANYPSCEMLIRAYKN